MEKNLNFKSKTMLFNDIELLHVYFDWPKRFFFVDYFIFSLVNPGLQTRKIVIAIFMILFGFKAKSIFHI